MIKAESGDGFGGGGSKMMRGRRSDVRKTRHVTKRALVEIPLRSEDIGVDWTNK